MADMTVANTILEQLGGRGFMVMTGARGFIGDTASLTFRLPSSFASKGINVVKVVLNGSDTYDVAFSKLRGVKLTPVSTHGDVYAEDLRNLFSTETGLALSLGSLARR